MPPTALASPEWAFVLVLPVLPWLHSRCLQLVWEVAPSPSLWRGGEAMGRCDSRLFPVQKLPTDVAALALQG